MCASYDKYLHGGESMNEYISNLAPLIVHFIAFKNALGIEYKTGGYYLKQLDSYNYSHENIGILDKKTAEGWVLTHAEKSVTRDRSWISPIREFGRYLKNIGYEHPYILDNRFVVPKYHAEVYLLTESEIQSFFKMCDCLTFPR